MKYILSMLMILCMAGLSMAADSAPVAKSVDQIKVIWELPGGPPSDIEGFKVYQVGIENPSATVNSDVFEATVDAPPDCSEWYVRTYKGNKISQESTVVEWCQPGTIDPDLPVPINVGVVEIKLK